MIWWAATALAGGLFVNDVQVDPAALAEIHMKSVDVAFDADGTIRITAPGYRIEPAPVAQVARAVPAAPTTAGRSRWWLVAEDLGSEQLFVQVRINGEPAGSFRSGQPHQLARVGSLLRPGTNTVRLEPAGERARGAIAVTLGPGSEREGAVVLDDGARREEIDGAAAGSAVEFTIEVGE